MALFERLNQNLNSGLNSKVLLPVQPTFLLEIVDLLLHKLNDRVSIVVISDSAHSVVQYSNINLEYLNTKLQEKIYKNLFSNSKEHPGTENPLSFDILLKSGRMQIFPTIQEYL